jgi:hypothetical protein
MLFIVVGNLVYTPVGPKHMLKCIDSLGMCTKNTTPDWKHFKHSMVMDLFPNQSIHLY